jgi:hypothetical protein
VLAGARKLLQSHPVQNVFMEISARDEKEIDYSQITLTVLLEAGYKLVGQGGYIGPDKPVPWLHDSEIISKIIEAARREGKAAECLVPTCKYSYYARCKSRSTVDGVSYIDLLMGRNGFAFGHTS